MRVVWSSFGGGYGDSPRALFEAVAARADLEHLWLTRPDRLGDFPAGVPTAPNRSPAARAALESADLIVSNDGLSWEWDKDPATVYLQTWHGTPLKRLHRDAVWNPAGRLPMILADVARWDHLLSPNPVSTPLFRSAFGYDGPVHETGYPRNDVLSSPRAGRRRAEVRQALGLPEGAVAVLWAPTWRDDLVLAEGRPDLDLPFDPVDFARSLPAGQVLLVRLHGMVADRLELDGDAPLLDVSRHPDISDLYLAADALVTDYSSAMFDFAVTGKPLLHFTYDLAHYRDDLRGFYFDLAEIAPGPLIATADELRAHLADLAGFQERTAERYGRFRETFCPLDDGHATDRVLDLLLEDSP